MKAIQSIQCLDISAAYALLDNIYLRIKWLITECYSYVLTAWK